MFSVIIVLEDSVSEEQEINRNDVRSKRKNGVFFGMF
jgi:hypothetical protein